MFSCEAQLFLRFLALGFRNLPLYPGPEKRSFLSKMSQKPSPCAASTQPKTKPEDISASFPVENRIPPPPRKTDSDISKVKKACCPTCPAARAPGAGDVQACRKPLPRALFTTVSRKPYRFARRLICPATHAPSAPKAAHMFLPFSRRCAGFRKGPEHAPASFPERSRSLPFVL